MTFPSASTATTDVPSLSHPKKWNKPLKSLGDFLGKKRNRKRDPNDESRSVNMEHCLRLYDDDEDDDEEHLFLGHRHQESDEMQHNQQQQHHFHNEQGQDEHPMHKTDTASNASTRQQLRSTVRDLFSRNSILKVRRRTSISVPAAAATTSTSEAESAAATTVASQNVTTATDCMDEQTQTSCTTASFPLTPTGDPSLASRESTATTNSTILSPQQGHDYHTNNDEDKSQDEDEPQPMHRNTSRPTLVRPPSSASLGSKSSPPPQSPLISRPYVSKDDPQHPCDEQNVTLVAVASNHNDERGHHDDDQELEHSGKRTIDDATSAPSMTIKQLLRRDDDDERSESPKKKFIVGGDSCHESHVTVRVSNTVAPRRPKTNIPVPSEQIDKHSMDKSKLGKTVLSSESSGLKEVVSPKRRSSRIPHGDDASVRSNRKDGESSRRTSSKESRNRKEFDPPKRSLSREPTSSSLKNHCSSESTCSSKRRKRRTSKSLPSSSGSSVKTSQSSSSKMERASSRTDRHAHTEPDELCSPVTVSHATSSTYHSALEDVDEAGGETQEKSITKASATSSAAMSWKNTLAMHEGIPIGLPTTCGPSGKNQSTPTSRMQSYNQETDTADGNTKKKHDTIDPRKRGSLTPKRSFSQSRDTSSRSSVLRSISSSDEDNLREKHSTATTPPRRRAGTRRRGHNVMEFTSPTLIQSQYRSPLLENPTSVIESSKVAEKPEVTSPVESTRPSDIDRTNEARNRAKIRSIEMHISDSQRSSRSVAITMDGSVRSSRTGVEASIRSRSRPGLDPTSRNHRSVRGAENSSIRSHRSLSKNILDPSCELLSPSQQRSKVRCHRSSTRSDSPSSEKNSPHHHRRPHTSSEDRRRRNVERTRSSEDWITRTPEVSSKKAVSADYLRHRPHSDGKTREKYDVRRSSSNSSPHGLEAPQLEKITQSPSLRRGTRTQSRHVSRSNSSSQKSSPTDSSSRHRHHGHSKSPSKSTSPSRRKSHRSSTTRSTTKEIPSPIPPLPNLRECLTKIKLDDEKQLEHRHTTVCESTTES